MRKARLGDIRNIQRQITAAIHSRLTMSASTLVLVLLAAALGIRAYLGGDLEVRTLQSYFSET